MKRIPKPICSPFKPKRNDFELEMPVYAALIAFERGIYDETHLYTLVAHAMMVRSIATGLEKMHAESLLRSLSKIKSQSYASKIDAAAVLASTHITGPWFHAQSKSLVATASHVAMAQLDLMEKNNGVC